MNEREFVRTGITPEIFGATIEPRLFDRSLTTAQPGTEGLDRYRMPEGRSQVNAQSTAVTSTWRARYQAAPAVTRYEATPGATTTEGQGANGQTMRQVRYEQGVSPGASPVASQEGPKSYSEMRVAAKTESSHSSKNQTPQWLVIGAEIAIAAAAIRFGLKYLPKSGINTLRESANLAKSTEAGAKGAGAGAQAAKPFVPDLGDLSKMPKSLLGPNGLPLIRTHQRPDGPLRVG